MLESLTGMKYAAQTCILILTLLNPSSCHPPRQVEPNVTIYPFQLTYSPAHVVKEVSTDVTLRCENNLNKASVLTNISWIRILKKDGESWDVLAELTQDGDVKVKESGTHFSSTGNISQVDTAYLEVRWSTADATTYGVFLCDLVGTDASMMTEVELSSEVEILEDEATTDDVLNMLLKVKDEMLPKKTLISWPAGEYALLKPESGCPVDLAFFSGDNSHMLFHVEKFSGPQSSLINIFKIDYDKYFELRFCQVNQEFNSIKWPEGSYCINKKNGLACPVGFTIGSLEDHGDSGMKLVRNTGKVDLYKYCCKSSAPPQVPIDLPTQSPFFLYRHGGECQNVRGMEVRLKYLDIGLRAASDTLPSPDTEQSSLKMCLYKKFRIRAFEKDKE